MALLRSDGAWLGLLEDRYVHVVAGVGTSSVLTGRLIPRDGTAEGRVVLTKVPVTVDDAGGGSDLFRPTQRAANIRRTVMVPLFTARGVVGVLTANDRGEPFTDDDVRMLQRLADQCAVAVFNARLFEEARAATLEWKVVFDAVPSGVVVLDERGHVVRFNARALTLTGGTAQTLLGRAFGAVLQGGADDGVPLPGPVADALESGAVTRGVVAATARGRLFDLLVSPHPDGGVVATFDDVTEVRALEQRHRSVVETASDAIMVTSAARRVTFANPAARELFGDDAIVGRPVEELVMPDQRAAVYRAESAAFEGRAQRYETLVRRADGEVRTVSVHTAPLLEPGGR
ncbi:MAG: PAS domain-containing protein, partial [Gemmatimonadaceae bacterium]|nr:PAS domain-containing protein [Gemmatimonadaceae bacterium]